jgi:hypothetical protein
MARWPETRTFPKNLAALRAWLRDTEAGRELLREAAKDVLENECRKCQRLRPYPKVLAVVRRLGFKPGVEIFHEKGVTVRCEELVDSKGESALEILCEDLLVAQLPKAWKHLPDCRSDSRVFRGLTVDQEIESRQTLYYIRAVEAMRHERTKRGE